jgi:flagellar P-ring protein precursor FlgI
MKFLVRLFCWKCLLILVCAIPTRLAGAQNAAAPENLPPPSATTPSAVTPLPQNEAITAPIPNIGNRVTSADSQRFPEPRPLAELPGFTVRVKDITRLEGHRSHTVEGLGLVVGLKNTGGKGELTQRVALSMLQNQGILIDQVATKSVSAVFITAEISPFHRPGDKIIATVAIADDATSLFGGVLQQTTLKALDGREYAVAKGALEIGGFSAEGQGATLRKNHDTVGKVEAQIEEAICEGPKLEGSFRLILKNKDYTTAYRIANEINRYFGGIAQAMDAGSVDVLIPRSFAQNPVNFLVMIQNLRVEPDNVARVVINEKTGTIVVGKNVRLSSVMFAKDNLVVATSETPIASQPAPFSEGETTVLPRTQIDAVQKSTRYNLMPANPTVGDLANLLNLLGVPPQDIISVFLALHQDGSLHAELVIE